VIREGQLREDLSFFDWDMLCEGVIIDATFPSVVACWGAVVPDFEVGRVKECLC